MIDILPCFYSTKTIYFTGERIVYFDNIAVLPTGGEMFWKYFYRKLSTGLEDVIQGTECVQNSTNLAILISKLNYSIGLAIFFKKKYIFSCNLISKLCLQDGYVQRYGAICSRRNILRNHLQLDTALYRNDIYQEYI